MDLYSKYLHIRRQLDDDVYQMDLISKEPSIKSNREMVLRIESARRGLNEMLFNVVDQNRRNLEAINEQRQPRKRRSPSPVASSSADPSFREPKQPCRVVRHVRRSDPGPELNDGQEHRPSSRREPSVQHVADVPYRETSVQVTGFYQPSRSELRHRQEQHIQGSDNRLMPPPLNYRSYRPSYYYDVSVKKENYHAAPPRRYQ